jgi:formamidopyrimidine-DNA glycosylase
MPELPEVETVRRGLVSVLEGRRLARVIARRGDLRWPLPPDLGQRLTGRRVERLERRAKYLLWRIEGGDVVILHLGMSGRVKVFTADPPAEERHDHLIFETEDGAVVRFCDPRRFGSLDLTTDGELAGHALLRNLGPEPLETGFDAAYLARRLTGKTGPIKAALMDQRLVAGLGNIYVCEALFRAGISPRRRAGSLSVPRLERLAEAVRAVLGEAIVAGGSTLRDHRRPDGELGYFQHRFAVYDREGQACPACTRGACPGVRRIVQAGRSTFYCPARQR